MTHTNENLFASLNLKSPLLKALNAEQYTTPTPIQKQAIPFVLQGRDLMGIAQTGTGKTAAFALPILHKLSDTEKRAMPRTCRALILAPTRELAAQIGESFRTYGKFTHLRQAVVFGGMPIGKQIRDLSSGVDILIATPGRLLDLANQRAIRFDDVKILVLDEADHMLDLGFIVPIRKLVKMLPQTRQTLMFSATMPNEIRSLAEDLLDNPAQVAVTPAARTVDKIEQHKIFVDQGMKPALLQAVIEEQNIARGIIFTRTKRGADKVAKALLAKGYDCVALHGNKSQGQRERALRDLRSGKTRFLIATDIAARGIDIDGLSHIINYDIPDVPESYVHRIGRTARAGASGVAIAFIANDEARSFRDIEKLMNKKVEVMEHRLGLKSADRREVASTRQQHHRAGRPQERSHERSSEQRNERPHGGGHRSDWKKPGASTKKFRPKYRRAAS